MVRLRVMVVEDDNFTRSMISSALRMCNLDVVAEASAVGPAMKYAELLKPDAAILDLDLGRGPNGIDLAFGLRKMNPKIGIVILTTFEDTRLLKKNIPDPPPGSVYLVKKEVGEVEALDKSIKKSISNLEGKEIILENIIQNPKFKNEISDVQMETLRLVAKGLSNSEIARLRNISEKSVEQTISRLAKQLGIENNPLSNQRVQITKIYYKLAGFPDADNE